MALKSNRILVAKNILLATAFLITVNGLCSPEDQDSSGSPNKDQVAKSPGDGDEGNQKALKKEAVAKQKADFLAKRQQTVETLNAIKLPENPSENDIKQYIGAIAATSDNLRGFSGKDPQVAKLKELGVENLKLLLDVYDSHPHNSHLNFAIGALATPEQKDLIISRLRNNEGLVLIVLKNKWEKDAEKILLEALVENRLERFPAQWVQAVVNLSDPATHTVLKNYFMNGPYKWSTYTLISKIPDIGITPEDVEEAWRRADKLGGGNEAECFGLALEAVKLGSKPALVSCANYLIENKDKKGSRLPMNHKRFMALIGYSGADADFEKWFNENKDKLEYNKISQAFSPGK